MKQAIAGILLILLLSAAAHAGDTINAAIPLVPPWAYFEEGSDSLQGMDAYLAKQLAAMLGAHVDYLPTADIRSGAKATAQGKAQLLTGCPAEEAKAQGLNLLHPAYRHGESLSFYIRPGRGPIIKGAADLKGWRIGAIKGLDVRDIAKAGAVVVTSDTYRNLFDVLLNGSIDAIAMPDATAAHWIRQFHLDGLIRKSPYTAPSKGSYHFAANRKWATPQRKAAAEAALREMIDSGLVEALLKQSLSH